MEQFLALPMVGIILSVVFEFIKKYIVEEYRTLAFVLLSVVVASIYVLLLKDTVYIEVLRTILITSAVVYSYLVNPVKKFINK